MWGQPFFKKNMSWLMPDKRPTDNMELAVDLPQEEEFALANMMPYTYYNFWFFLYPFLPPTYFSIEPRASANPGICGR